MFIHLVSRKRVKNEGFRFETKLLKDETHTVKKGVVPRKLSERILI